MSVKNISSAILGVGVDDTTIDLFESQYPVPTGVSYNSYVIRDEKTAVLDTVDALSSYQPLEKKLQILKDSHAGAFAIIMGCAYFTLGLGVWSEMKTELLPVMAVAFALSRALSGLALSTFPKANKSGSLSMFSDAAQKKILLGTLTLWILACGAAALWLNPVIGGIMLLTQAAVFWYYHHVAMKEFGGTTGDIAGFFVQVCELACACTVMLGGKLL